MARLRVLPRAGPRRLPGLRPGQRTVVVRYALRAQRPGERAPGIDRVGRQRREVDALPAQRHLRAARRPRQAARHRVHHLARHRATEARQPHLLHRAGVDDRARRNPVGDHRPRGVQEPQREGLLALVDRVVEHRHRDRLLRLARVEGELALARRVVRARRRAAVGGRIRHRHRRVRRPAQPHREVQRRTRRLAYPRVRHRHRNRTLNHRRDGVGEPPPRLALGADRPGHRARTPRKKRDRHVPDRCRPYRHLEQVAPAVHAPAARDTPAGHRERVLAKRPEADPDVLAERHPEAEPALAAVLRRHVHEPRRQPRRAALHRRAGHRRRGRVGELPAVLPLGADRTRDPALAARRQRDGHLAVPVRLDRHLEEIAPVVHAPAPRHPAPGHRERVLAQAAVADPDVLAERHPEGERALPVMRLRHALERRRQRRRTRVRTLDRRRDFLRQRPPVRGADRSRLVARTPRVQRYRQVAVRVRLDLELPHHLTVFASGIPAARRAGSRAARRIAAHRAHRRHTAALDVHAVLAHVLRGLVDRLAERHPHLHPLLAVVTLRRRFEPRPQRPPAGAGRLRLRPLAEAVAAQRLHEDLVLDARFEVRARHAGRRAVAASLSGTEGAGIGLLSFLGLTARVAEFDEVALHRKGAIVGLIPAHLQRPFLTLRRRHTHIRRRRRQAALVHQRHPDLVVLFPVEVGHFGCIDASKSECATSTAGHHEARVADPERQLPGQAAEDLGKISLNKKSPGVTDIDSVNFEFVVGVDVMFVGRGPGRVVERPAGADFSPSIVLVVSKMIVGLAHRHGGAPEIEVGVLRAVGPVVRGIRLRRRQGEGAGKTEARHSGHRAGGTEERAPRTGEAREARRPAGGGYSVWRGMAAPAGRSALGARRSALLTKVEPTASNHFAQIVPIAVPLPRRSP